MSRWLEFARAKIREIDSAAPAVKAPDNAPEYENERSQLGQLGQLGRKSDLTELSELTEPVSFPEKQQFTAPELSERSDAVEQLVPLFDGPAVTLLAVPDGVPAEWVAGYAQMLSMPAPHGVPDRAWQAAIDSCERFMESEWPAPIAALGWSTLEVFGVHPRAPFQNHSCRGLGFYFGEEKRLSLPTADTATFQTKTDNKTKFYRKSVQPGGIPAWELNQSTTNEREKP